MTVSMRPSPCQVGAMIGAVLMGFILSELRRSGPPDLPQPTVFRSESSWATRPGWLDAKPKIDTSYIPTDALVPTEEGRLGRRAEVYWEQQLPWAHDAAEHPAIRQFWTSWGESKFIEGDGMLRIVYPKLVRRVSDDLGDNWEVTASRGSFLANIYLIAAGDPKVDKQLSELVTNKPSPCKPWLLRTPISPQQLGSDDSRSPEVVRATLLQFYD